MNEADAIWAIRKALDKAFAWDQSPQGREYWVEVMAQLARAQGHFYRITQEMKQ